MKSSVKIYTTILLIFLLTSCGSQTQKQRTDYFKKIHSTRERLSPLINDYFLELMVVVDSVQHNPNYRMDPILRDKISVKTDYIVSKIENEQTSIKAIEPIDDEFLLKDKLDKFVGTLKKLIADAAPLVADIHVEGKENSTDAEQEKVKTFFLSASALKTDQQTLNSDMDKFSEKYSIEY